MAMHTKNKCRTIRGKRVCKHKTKRAVKGARSKTHRGEKDYTTKKGDKDFHRKGHDEKHAAQSRKVRKPYAKSKKGGWNWVDFAKRREPHQLDLAEFRKRIRAARRQADWERMDAMSKKGGGSIVCANFHGGPEICDPDICEGGYCMPFLARGKEERRHASPLTESAAGVLTRRFAHPSEAY